MGLMLVRHSDLKSSIYLSIFLPIYLKINMISGCLYKNSVRFKVVVMAEAMHARFCAVIVCLVVAAIGILTRWMTFSLTLRFVPTFGLLLHIFLSVSLLIPLHVYFLIANRWVRCIV